MILSALLRRPVRLIEQLARPLPPLLTAVFEDSATGALVLDRDRRIVRTNRCLDAMLATCGSALSAGGAIPASGSVAPASGGADPSPGGAAPDAGGAVPKSGGTPLASGGVALTTSVPALEGPAEALFAQADRRRVEAALAAGLRGEPAPPQQVRLRAGTPSAALMVTLSVAPLRERDGKISGLLLWLHDASAEQRLEAELVQLQKLQAVGQLAGGIAHDFNNLLTAIGAAADSVLERGGCPPATLDDIRQIRQSTDRGAALVHQLLAFGRRQPLLPAVVAVNAAIRNLSGMLARLLGEQIRLELDLEEPGRSIRVDPTQLDQVLVNLAVNARDAMPAGGTLTLRTGHLTLYGPRRVGSDTMPPGRYVAIDVADTGEGIAPAVLPRVFEPFFTTRRDRGGSGLGLSTVQGIVRQSGGFVTVESAVGQGTCVRFWLPRHQATEVVSGRPLAGVMPAREKIDPSADRHPGESRDPGSMGPGFRRDDDRARGGGHESSISRAGVTQVVAPGAGPPRAGAPKVDGPKVDGPKVDGPRVGSPAEDALGAAATRRGVRRTGAPVPAAPSGGVPEHGEPAMATAPPPPAPTAAPYILLVEDEESVRRLTERALRRAGWEVSAVDSAEAALERLPRPGDPDAPPCVMVSDIMLPGIDGTDLVRAARAVWPDLPAVLVSGYTDSALLGDLTAQGVAFLSKPFRLQELVACVDRAAARNPMAGPGNRMPEARCGSNHVGA